MEYTDVSQMIVTPGPGSVQLITHTIRMKTLICLLIGLLPGFLAAQTQPTQWHHLDPRTDSVMGISTERAYRELLNGRKATPVIVAIIDTGIDTTHIDLKRVLWTNPKEIPGNGRDDDKNGYVDDLHGWNFLGGKDGRNIQYSQYEHTRIYQQGRSRYEGKSIERTSLSFARQREYDLYQKAYAAYQKRDTEAKAAYEQMSTVYSQAFSATDRLKKAFNVAILDTALLRHPPTNEPELLNLSQVVYYQISQRGFIDADAALRDLQQKITRQRVLLDYSLNLDYSPQSVVGDDPDNLGETGYGNADIQGPDPYHGTHVAGILAADRTNALGVNGVVGQVQLMTIRAIPDDDERDKDVANAIRYAVDNGAKIINMSFGKFLSAHQELVDQAIQYANANGVLLVRCSQNQATNLDSTVLYPSPRFLNGQQAPNLVTVGATASKLNQRIVYWNSNYGQVAVDVFAPGVQIYSTMPGHRYANNTGTSMASPLVAGIAAVLKSYFPQLTSQDIKRIILQSAVPIYTTVYKPGTRQLVDFATLSKTGGIVNLYEAVKLALAQSSPTAEK